MFTPPRYGIHAMLCAVFNQPLFTNKMYKSEPEQNFALEIICIEIFVSSSTFCLSVSRLGPS
jgi:hypothetical protein